MEKKNEEYPRRAKMFSAAFSNSLASFLLYPLDVLKIKGQIQQDKQIHVIKEVFKNKGIYRGVLGATVRSLVQSGIRFELYEEAKRQEIVDTFQRKMLLASGCGGLAGFLATPMAKVLIRQNNPWFTYKSIIDGVRILHRSGGFRMIFAGAQLSSLRGIMNSIGQFVFYDETKSKLLSYPDIFEDNIYTSLIASVTAGSVATLLQVPIEVVQVTYMNAIPGKFENPADVFKSIGRRYGILGFYRGLTPGFMRIIPQTVITYIVLEYLRASYGVLRKV